MTNTVCSGRQSLELVVTIHAVSSSGQHALCCCKAKLTCSWRGCCAYKYAMMRHLHYFLVQCWLVSLLTCTHAICRPQHSFFVWVQCPMFCDFACHSLLPPFACPASTSDLCSAVAMCLIPLICVSYGLQRIKTSRMRELLLGKVSHRISYSHTSLQRPAMQADRYGLKGSPPKLTAN